MPAVAIQNVVFKIARKYCCADGVQKNCCKPAAFKSVDLMPQPPPLERPTAVRMQSLSAMQNVGLWRSSRPWFVRNVVSQSVVASASALSTLRALRSNLPTRRCSLRHSMSNPRSDWQEQQQKQKQHRPIQDHPDLCIVYNRMRPRLVRLAKHRYPYGAAWRKHRRAGDDAD